MFGIVSYLNFKKNREWAGLLLSNILYSLFFGVTENVLHLFLFVYVLFHLGR